MPSDQIVQLAIAVLGPAAIWLSQSRSARFQRWACIVGLASQPFWFWAVMDSGQWGVGRGCLRLRLRLRAGLAHDPHGGDSQTSGNGSCAHGVDKPTVASVMAGMSKGPFRLEGAKTGRPIPPPPLGRCSCIRPCQC